MLRQQELSSRTRALVTVINVRTTAALNGVYAYIQTYIERRIYIHICIYNVRTTAALNGVYTYMYTYGTGI
jgi:hypothetical protein